MFNMNSDDLLYNGFLKSNSEMFRAQFKEELYLPLQGQNNGLGQLLVLPQCGISYDLYTLLGHTNRWLGS